MAITNATQVPVGAHASLMGVLKVSRDVILHPTGLFSGARPIIVKGFTQDGAAIFAQQSVKSYLKDQLRGTLSFNVRLARDFVLAKQFDKNVTPLAFDLVTTKKILPQQLEPLRNTYLTLQNYNAISQVKQGESILGFVREQHPIERLADGVEKAHSFGKTFRTSSNPLVNGVFKEWLTDHYKTIHNVNPEALLVTKTKTEFEKRVLLGDDIQVATPTEPKVILPKSISLASSAYASAASESLADETTVPGFIPFKAAAPKEVAIRPKEEVFTNTLGQTYAKEHFAKAAQLEQSLLGNGPIADELLAPSALEYGRPYSEATLARNAKVKEFVLSANSLPANLITPEPIEYRD